MNESILARGGADDERRSLSRRAFIASLAALPAMKKMMLLATMAMIALAMFAMASPAHAASLRVSCAIYATNHVDPIVLGSGHLHRQIGNLSTNDSSTYKSLYNSDAGTSCGNADYLTSAAWWPVEQNEPSSTGILYYRAPGDQSQVRKLPEGIQLVAQQVGVGYNCGAGPLEPTTFQDTPPYSCTDNWATHIRMPACWDGNGLTPDHTVYGVNGSRTNCPASHPNRLTEVNLTVVHKNTDGHVPKPLQISCGVDLWCDYTHMHGDYFFAAQDEVNQNVDLDGDGNIELRDADGDGTYEPWQENATHLGDSEQNLADLCWLKAPQKLAYNNARCRADGLLDAHIRALKNYY